MATVLITGASGFIGSHLVRAYAEAGWEVLVVGKKGENGLPDSVQVVGDDITKLTTLPRIDVLNHHAGITDSQCTDRAELWRVNVDGAMNLFRLAARSGVKRIVYASSCAVYGMRFIPFTESAQTQPLTEYAESKLELDRQAAEFSALTGIPVVGLRYTNVYGAGEGHKGKAASMVWQIVRASEHGQPIRLFRGSPVRDFVNITDVVQANLLATEHGSGVYNIGSGEAVALETVVKLVKPSPTIDYIDCPFDRRYQWDTRTNIAKAQQELGFYPSNELNINFTTRATTDKRPCHCNRYSKVYQPGHCRLCWLFHHNVRYHLQWGGTEETWAALDGEEKPTEVEVHPPWFQRYSPVQMDVSVIVPLYRSQDVIEQHVRHWDLLAADGLHKEVIYVEDGCPARSGDLAIRAWNGFRDNWHKLLAQIQISFSYHIGRVIRLSKNSGYSHACNVGAKYARGKYLIFLNADTIVTHGWLRPMVDALADERNGVVGNLQLKQDGTIDSAGSEWRWDSGMFEHIGRNVYGGKRLSRMMHYRDCPADLRTPGEREMVTGCCLGIRKQLFQQVGGFDEGYRIGYWEDTDLNMKVREAGYKVYYEPRSMIYHKVGHSGAGRHAFLPANARRFFDKWVRTGKLDQWVRAKRPT